MNTDTILHETNLTWGMNQVIYAIIKESPMPFADKVHLLRDVRSNRDWLDEIGFKQTLMRDCDLFGIGWARMDAILNCFFGDTIWDHPTYEPNYIESARERVRFK